METKYVLMIGGRGVGKSSVLAAIYDQAGEILNNVDLDWQADEAAFDLLKPKKAMLKDAFKKNDITIDIPRLGDPEASEYTFEIGKKGEPANFNLVFIDTSGDKFNGINGEKFRDEFNDYFKISRTAMIVIDTVELMEGDNIIEKHKSNDPDEIHRYIQEWMKYNQEEPRLLCIVPTKTETWIRERQGWDHRAEAYKVTGKIMQEFSKTFSYILDEKFENQLAVVIAPVQTCGNLIFDEFQFAGTPRPIGLFKKIKGKSSGQQRAEGYSPLDCDQPLRYVLNFYIKQFLLARQKQSYNEIPNWVKILASTFGKRGNEILEEIFRGYQVLFKDAEFADAIEKFGKGIKTKMPFQILQGDHLIK